MLPRRVVAVGSLERVWSPRPEEIAEEQLEEAFGRRFGVAWADVLDAADKSFAYNVANDAYFSVRDLRPLEGLTLEELLEKNGGASTTNVIVS